MDISGLIRTIRPIGIYNQMKGKIYFQQKKSHMPSRSYSNFDAIDITASESFVESQWDTQNRRSSGCDLDCRNHLKTVFRDI
ncbi:hypothetical protein TNCT_609041 [Trichonephila clavata]|uniref:Uncharacterized protein n=1 Tax=Trichonephila clavata TaxID=2740835 RepID=A0A8X6JK44_TRICU|nr:hypothetical protein TNCT_609041 [Trichonephila clavata]